MRYFPDASPFLSENENDMHVQKANVDEWDTEVGRGKLGVGTVKREVLMRGCIAIKGKSIQGLGKFLEVHLWQVLIANRFISWIGSLLYKHGNGRQSLFFLVGTSRQMQLLIFIRCLHCMHITKSLVKFE